MNNTYLPLIGAVLFSTGIFALLLLLLRLILRIYKTGERSGRRFRKASTISRLLVILGGLTLVFFSQTIFWVSGELRSYRLVRNDEALCSLDMYTPSDRLPRLIYSTTGGLGNELVEVFPVRDARVRLAGEIIEWPPWLEPLGLGKFFKLTKLEFLSFDSTGMRDATFSVPVHQGSMPVFRRLSGWPSRLSIALTRTVQTPILPTDSTFSYNLFLRGDRLCLQ